MGHITVISTGGKQGVPGPGSFPTGGTSGQVFTKRSSANFDAGWSDPAPDSDGSATWGQIDGELAQQADLQAVFANLQAFAAAQG